MPGERKGMACDPGSSNGSSATIEPEVLPAYNASSPGTMQMMPGAHGMVDARLFYLVIGALAGVGLCMYCSSRGRS